MAKLRILNAKEIKEFRAGLLEQYGFSGRLEGVFLQNERDKIFLITETLSKINLSALRINTVGLYIAQWVDVRIRITIDGAQLLGGLCSKNIVELGESEVREWMRGEQLSKNLDYPDGTFVLLRRGTDFFGSGKYIKGTILNYVGKARRMHG